MIDIPARRVKSIVSPWGTVSIDGLVFAVPKEHIGQEVYVTISATIELAERVDAFKELISEAIEPGMALEDFAAATETLHTTLSHVTKKKEDLL